MNTYYVAVLYGGYELHEGKHADFDALEDAEEIIEFPDETWSPLTIELFTDENQEVDSRCYPTHPWPSDWNTKDNTLVRVETEATYSFESETAYFGLLTYNNKGAIFYNDVRLDCDDCEGIFRAKIIEQ